MSWSTSELRSRLARRETGLSPPVEYFTDRTKTVKHRPGMVSRLFCGLSMLFLSCFCYAVARLFIDALWSPAGKELTFWLSFLVSYFEIVTFPLVSWVRCDAWLYRVLILSLFLTFIMTCVFMLFFRWTSKQWQCRTTDMYTIFTFWCWNQFETSELWLSTYDLWHMTFELWLV